MLPRLALERSCCMGVAWQTPSRTKGGFQEVRGLSGLPPVHNLRVVTAKLTRGDGGELNDDDAYMTDIMQAVQDGVVTPAEGVKMLHAYNHKSKEAFDFSSLTHETNSIPEIVLGSDKTPEQIAESMASLSSKQNAVVAVRIPPAVYAAVRKLLPGVEYHAGGQILTLRTSKNGTKQAQSRLPGTIAILIGGSESMVVAEECRLVAEHLGCYCFKVPNAKSSDLRAVVKSSTAIQSAAIVVVVSGADVALPSIIAGIVDAPVISVPSDSGLTSALGGKAMMMTSGNPVAQGITFVGADDGVAAAVSSARILMSVNKINDMKNNQHPRHHSNGVEIASTSSGNSNGTDISITNGSEGLANCDNEKHAEYENINAALEAINNACHLPNALNGSSTAKEGSEGGN